MLILQELKTSLLSQGTNFHESQRHSEYQNVKTEVVLTGNLKIAHSIYFYKMMANIFFSHK